MDELILRTGPYRTTLIGTEITRPSTTKEWHTYGEILRHVEEAKQWAIGDWLVDGKRHYGDRLYKEAAGILDLEQRTLEDQKRIANLFEFTLRNVNLLWWHHREVSSLKLPETVKDKKLSQGRMQWSHDPDKAKMQDFLKLAEDKEWSVRELRIEVEQYKRNKEREFALHNSPETFDLIYADPPWQYDFSETDSRKIENQYPTMTVVEISSLQPPSADDSVLFLWATAPKLEEALQVMRGWGFKYVTHAIWDKE